MSTDKVKDYMIKATANQLGINEKDVKMDTVIPDIYNMVMFACLKLNKAAVINNIHAKHTVKDAIRLFS